MSTVEIRKEQDKIIVNMKCAQYLWFFKYLDGYYKSTFELLKQLHQDNATIIFPILLCISQYLELWVKSIALSIYDSNDVKKSNIGNHNITGIIDHLTENEELLLSQYGVSIKQLKNVSEKCLYFNHFACLNSNLSMAARFPINYGKTDIIINFDRIDEAKKDDFDEFKRNAIDILQICNNIKDIFFEQYLSKKTDGLIRHITITQ